MLEILKWGDGIIRLFFPGKSEGNHNISDPLLYESIGFTLIHRSIHMSAMARGFLLGSQPERDIFSSSDLVELPE